jgi:excisionase family DNA binding protein
VKDEERAVIDSLEADYGRFMTPGEVARSLRVGPKTVARWAQEGRLSAIRTPGGHRRYHEAEILGLVNGPAS